MSIKNSSYLPLANHYLYWQMSQNLGGYLLNRKSPLQPMARLRSLQIYGHATKITALSLVGGCWDSRGWYFHCVRLLHPDAVRSQGRLAGGSTIGEFLNSRPVYPLLCRSWGVYAPLQLDARWVKKNRLSLYRIHKNRTNHNSIMNKYLSDFTVSQRFFTMKKLFVQ